MSVEITGYCEKCKHIRPFRQVIEPSFTLLYCLACGASTVTPKSLGETQREVARIKEWAERVMAGKN